MTVAPLARSSRCQTVHCPAPGVDCQTLAQVSSTAYDGKKHRTPII